MPMHPRAPRATATFSSKSTARGALVACVLHLAGASVAHGGPLVLERATPAAHPISARPNPVTSVVSATSESAFVGPVPAPQTLATSATNATAAPRQAAASSTAFTTDTRLLGVPATPAVIAAPASVASLPVIERRALGAAKDSSALGSLAGMALPLGVVLGIMVLCVAVLKRAMRGGTSLASALGAGGKAPAGIIDVLGRFPVAKGQLLVLVKVDRRVLLLGHSAPTRGSGHAGGGFTTLCEMTDPEEVASLLQRAEASTAVTAPFASLLRRQADEPDDSDGVTEVKPMMPRVSIARAISAVLQRPLPRPIPAPVLRESEQAATRRADGPKPPRQRTESPNVYDLDDDAQRDARQEREVLERNRREIARAHNLELDEFSPAPRGRGADERGLRFPTARDESPADSLRELNRRLTALQGRSTGAHS
ncbi:hypothetical protein BH11PLA1_BH11PLA1_09840 [soil metagenome]